MSSSPNLTELSPLSSIEQFHLHDSNERYPNKVGCRLLCAGTIDPEIARQACHWLALRHPIIQCRPLSSGRRWLWMQDKTLYSFDSNQSGQLGQPLGIVDSNRGDASCDPPWFHLEHLIQPPQAPPDFLSNCESLQQQDWLMMPRIIVRQWHQPAPRFPKQEKPSEGQSLSPMTELWLIIHHAWCDGGGGIAIINDWMEIYENLILVRAPLQGMSKVDLQRFNQRNHLGLIRWNYLKRIPFQVVGLYGTFKFLFRRTAQLPAASKLTPAQIKDRPTYCPQLCSRWVDSAILTKLDEADRRAGQNLNSRLLAEWFGTLESFLELLVTNSENSKSNRRPWIRVIVPINIREIADRRLSAANRSSLVQVDRRNLQSPATDSQVASIYRELGVIIGWKLDRLFLIAIRLISWFPGLLARVAQNDKHRGLSVFTNLGTPFRRLEKQRKKRRDSAGNSQEEGRRERGQPQGLEPIEIDFVAPLRNGTPLNLTLARYQGKLRLSLHYDSNIVQRRFADWLLDKFLERLYRVARLSDNDGAVPK